MKYLVEEVEKKFEVLFTISIFYAVLMGTYYAIAGGTQQEKNAAFALFPLVGFYILSYVLFEISKLLPPLELALQTLDWMLLLAIACFAIPALITIVALGPIVFTNSFSYHIDILSLIGSLAGIGALPPAILLFTGINLLLELFAVAFKKLANKKVF
jgi:hypothetical protein